MSLGHIIFLSALIVTIFVVLFFCVGFFLSRRKKSLHDKRKEDLKKTQMRKPNFVHIRRISHIKHKRRMERINTDHPDIKKFSIANLWKYYDDGDRKNKKPPR